MSRLALAALLWPLAVGCVQLPAPPERQQGADAAPDPGGDEGAPDVTADVAEAGDGPDGAAVDVVETSPDGGEPTWTCVTEPTLAVATYADSDWEPPHDNPVALVDLATGSGADPIAHILITGATIRVDRLAGSPDGCLLAMTEPGFEERLTAVDASGAVRFQASGAYASVDVTSDRVFAARGATFSGDELHAYSWDGQLVGSSVGLSGTFVVADEARGRVWTAGTSIKKGSYDLEQLWGSKPYFEVASSLDLGPDGTVWVTSMKHPGSGVGENVLFHIDEDLTIIDSFPLDAFPQQVRVARDGSAVWVGTNSAVERRDPVSGEILATFPYGVYTVQPDLRGNAWVVGTSWSRLLDPDAQEIGELDGVPAGAKFATILGVGLELPAAP